MKKIFLVFILLVAISAGCVTTQNVVQSNIDADNSFSSDNLPVEGLKVGNLAPEFTLIDLNDNEFSLSELRGKPTIIYFFASWCASCIPESQALAKIKIELGDAVNILFIDIDTRTDTAQDLFNFVFRYGYPTFISAMDSTIDPTSLKYRVVTLETSYLVDSNGVITYKDTGPTSYETYQRELGGLIG